jgi:hypothetical protein
MVGGGFSFELNKSAVFYFLEKVELGLGEPRGPGYRVGPVGEAGVLLNFSERLSGYFSSNYHYPLLGYTEPYGQESAELRISPSRNIDIRLGADHYPISSQMRVGLNVYY